VQNTSSFKTSFLYYIDNFGTYDYAAFAWLIVIFFVAVLLSIVTAKKSPIFSILTLFLALFMLFTAPFAIKHYLDKYIRTSLSKIVSIKKLNFSDTLIVDALVANVSKKSFSTCKVTVSVIVNSDSKIKNFLNQLKPLREQTIFVNETIDINTSKNIRVIFDNYIYNKEINATVNSECY